MVTITIPMAPDSRMFPNKSSKSLHWRTRHAARAKSRSVAAKAAAKCKPPEPIKGPVVCTIHAEYGYRRRVPDLDATVAASKSFLDSLQDVGIIVDDKQIVKIIATHQKMVVPKGEKWPGITTITIEEAE